MCAKAPQQTSNLGLSDLFNRPCLLILWTCSAKENEASFSFVVCNPCSSLFIYASCCVICSRCCCCSASFNPPELSQWGMVVHPTAAEAGEKSTTCFINNMTLFSWADSFYWSSRWHLSGQTAVTKLASVPTTWSLISSDVMQNRIKNKAAVEFRDEWVRPWTRCVAAFND